jgi:signal recognition particle GTPase
MTKKSPPAGKIPFKEASHAFKLKVVHEIENGLISKNYAAKKYLATRSTIDYWCKKIGTDMSEPKNQSLKKENKKLKQEIEELKLLTDIRMDIIDALIKELGEENAKKLYPKQLIEEVRKMGKNLK